MTENAVVVAPSGAALAEQVVIKGDLSKLSDIERMQYYTAVCNSLGLNPLTRPFEYITLNSKLTLYATRGAGDQLRRINSVTITGLVPSQIGDLYVVVASGTDRNGRADSSTGAVSVKGLTGEALANAMMKAETKAKRRLTLSLVGLGLLDESEIASIPTAVSVDVDPDTGQIRKPLTLAERAKAATADSAPAIAVPSRDEDGFEALVTAAPPIFTVPAGISAPALAALCVQNGKTKGELAVAIGTLFGTIPAPTAVSEAVKALTDEQRGELADSLKLAWRP